MGTHLFCAAATRILYRAALLLAVTAIGAHAQSVPKITSGYRISGTVINAASSEPVRRAMVVVLSQETDGHIVESAETDNDGRFSLDGLPAAKFPLTASKRGFLTAFYDQHEGYNTAIVTGADQDTSGLVFRLTPGAALRGVVTGDGGDPVDGAKVMLFLKPHGHNPGARITQAGEAATDDTGAYEFDDLAAGEYLVAVMAQPWFALHFVAVGVKQKPEAETNPLLDVAYPVTFFDSTTEETSATTISLSGGSLEEANINLRALPALHLKVESPLNQENRVAPVNLRYSFFGVQSPFEGIRSPYDAQRGTVEFIGVAPGHYELTQGVNPEHISEIDLSSNLQVDPNSGTLAEEIRGILRSADSSVLPENMVVVLSSIDNAQLHAARQAPTSRQESYNFGFGTVPSGRWELLAYASGRTLPIASLTMNGRMHPGNQLTVRDKPIQLLATVSQSETRVEGFARNEKGKGQPGMMIVLVPKEPSAFRALVRRDQSDSDGSFSLRDVVPGQYTVVAIQDGWELDWGRPEVIGRYLSHGVAVIVTESSGKLLKLSQPVLVQRP
jgi:Carboxypeptidase regulatory-like domain